MNRLEEISRELHSMEKDWDKAFYDIPYEHRNPDSPAVNALRDRSRRLDDEARKIVENPVVLPDGFEYGHPGLRFPDNKWTVAYAVRILPSVNSPVRSWGAIVPLDKNANKRLNELGFEDWKGSFLTPTKYKDTHLVRYAAPRDFIVAPEGKQSEFADWFNKASVVAKSADTEELVSPSEASEAGAELSRYGLQKRKYKKPHTKSQSRKSSPSGMKGLKK